uniref:Uncharacterized protein LOC111101728 n=1 Tax=Crassostrea virginica TaxID=6565 RepID=A0A8B8AF47_CRAVI|nr:uncharacterized protein LOC111101728 [Crassostrea virginica]
MCQNTTCKHKNIVPTGKRHGRIWDANTKLAAGMIHTGIGPAQVNGLLTALNIPPVSTRTLQARQNETGLAVESVAEESMQECLEEEIQETVRNEGNEDLTVSVDAGWQKRGSGRSFDSLSGHCSMIGTQTGKVLDCEVRIKSCRICEHAKREKNQPKDHNCRQNWQGSSKSMEQDMVISMVKKKLEKGINISTVICDEDTTTMSRLRQNVSHSITKMSDKNHIKKNFTSTLYSLKTKHKSLTTRVIRYFLKCFNYLLAQNKENPSGIEQGLDALGKHPFGNHSSCDKTWCAHADDPTKKYSSLPYGKPLHDEKLQEEVMSICSRLKQNSSNLSRLGSTQGNESFNKSVSLKAPKNHHFSGSGSLNYRLAASVAEKNSGQKHLVEVNKKIGLSPGKHTKKLCYLRESQSRKRRAIARTREAKRRRIELKAKKCQGTATREIREGPTYESGIDLCTEKPDYIQIPPPSFKPELETVPICDQTLVFFDLETTGLARTSHITQLAAVHGNETFSTYVMPDIPITPSASDITGLEVRNGILYHHGKKVNTLSISVALDSFFSFLEKFSNVILVGHNIKTFDCPVLLEALESCRMIPKLTETVKGFLDTRILFKTVHPNLHSYSQQSLAKTLLNMSYNAHDALDDVLMLQSLVNKVEFSEIDHNCSTFSCQYACDIFNYQKLIHKNLPSLQCLIDQNVISLGMAKKIAGSGLDFSCLNLECKRNQDGIYALFTEKSLNCKFVRVTNSKRILDSVNEFFMSLNES